ncbi:hypothetical protein E4U35_000872, partial [Claviceps purpurea]
QESPALRGMIREKCPNCSGAHPAWSRTPDSVLWPTHNGPKRDRPTPTDHGNSPISRKMTTHSPEEEETPETNSPWSVSMESQSYRTQPTPCLRECLRECIRHADGHSTLKLMIRVLYWNTRKRKQLINIVLNFNVELDVIAIQEVNNEDQIPYGAEGCLHSQATRAWDVDLKEGVEIFSVYSPTYGGQWTIPIKELMSMPARSRSVFVGDFNQHHPL